MKYGRPPAFCHSKTLTMHKNLNISIEHHGRKRAGAHVLFGVFLRKSKWLIDPNSENVLPYWEFDLRAQWENVLPKKIFFYQIRKSFYQIGKLFYQPNFSVKIDILVFLS